MQLKTTAPSDEQTLSEVFSQMLTNDTVNQTVDDTAILDTGIGRGNVVKYSSASGKWVLCNGTVKLEPTDTVGIVEYANGTSGQVRTSGVYLDATLTSTLPYYCQTDGTLGITATKIFMGCIASSGRFMMVSGSGGSIQPATSDSLGGIIPGTGFEVDSDGKVSLNTEYPTWFYDRGDGSDGDFYPTSNVTISGVKNYTSVNIPAGVTVTVGAEPLYIKCQTLCNIAGIINGKGKEQLLSSDSNSVGGSGYGKNPNRTNGISSPFTPIGSGGSCSLGNVSQFNGVTVAFNGTTPSSASQKMMSNSNLPCAGSAGAYIPDGDTASVAYGGGAGTVRVVAGSVINTGSISVLGGKQGTGNGNNQYCMPSGGASIIIVANDFSLTGAINVDGADALNSSAGARTASGWYFVKEVG